ncbi:MAG: chemotaxis protein CheD [Deltaproteobacteria bacterium]|nr:chemotaxis protein CheD [Deltaproteobacteria bacterium]
MAVDCNIIKVKIADYKIGAAPDILVTNGLGSCVGLSLYDKEKKMGCLAHIMLPNSTKAVEEKFYPRYADTAINLMLEKLGHNGCSSISLEAKMAGGASMFPALKKENKGVGDRNVEAILEILQTHEIRLIGSDTGGSYGRSIEFSTDSGKMSIKSIQHGILEI